MRRASELGPGLGGARRSATPDERDAIARQFEAFGEALPAFIAIETEWVDRQAKLFEAGEYPDKGVAVSVQDLGALAATFDLPVPVLIEHAESPLQLGYLTGVQQVGRELFGNLALTKEADALVRKSGASSLSLGLSPDLREIIEVSLVRNPRVESARMFSGSVRFSANLELSDGPSFRHDYERLKAEHRAEDTERQVQGLVRAGKLCPAQAAEAKALLMTEDVVEFGNDRRPVRQLLLDLLSKQPPMHLFAEVAPNPHAADNLLLPEEAAFYQRHFPEVSLEEIAKRKTR